MFGFVTVEENKLAKDNQPMTYAMENTLTNREKEKYYENINTIKFPHPTSISTTITTIPYTKGEEYDTKKKGEENNGYVINGGRWTRQEHENFLIGLTMYGREWKKVAQKIKTRTSAQIRSHAQKYFAKLAKESQSNENSNTTEVKENIEGTSNRITNGNLRNRLLLSENRRTVTDVQKLEERRHSPPEAYSPTSTAAQAIRTISLLANTTSITVHGSPSTSEEIEKTGNQIPRTQEEKKPYPPSNKRGIQETFSIAQEDRIKVSHLREEEMCAIEVLLGYISQSKRPRHHKLLNVKVGHEGMSRTLHPKWRARAAARFVPLHMHDSERPRNEEKNTRNNATMQSPVLSRQTSSNSQSGLAIRPLPSTHSTLTERQSPQQKAVC